MNEKKCTCNRFKANIRYLHQIHGGNYADYEYWDYCPWCGEPLEREQEEEQADFPAGIA